MKWLLHGTMTSAVGGALGRHGQEVHEVAELGLAEGAGAAEVLEAAGKRQWEVITKDGGLAKAALEGRGGFGRTIVYLQLEGGDVEEDDAVERLFGRYKRLSGRRLYTVTGSRVKIRQLPGAACKPRRGDTEAR